MTIKAFIRLAIKSIKREIFGDGFVYEKGYPPDPKECRILSRNDGNGMIYWKVVMKKDYSRIIFCKENIGVFV